MLQQISEQLQAGKAKIVKELVRQAIDQGYTPQDILENGLLHGMGIIGEKSDLFISLIDNGDFPIDFISKCTKARFKIGRHAYEGDAFDMIFHGGAREELRGDVCRVFEELTEFLEKVC